MTKRRLSVVALAMAVGLLGFWTAAKTWEGESTGQPLHRLAADFDFIGETSTTVGVFPNSDGSAVGDDGRLIYKKTVSVPSDHNVLYVTISATGDTHDGAALWLGCRVDGNDCNTLTGGAGGTNNTGYVALQKMPSIVLNGDSLVATCDDGGGGFGDCHDNNVNYTWCIPIVPDEWSGPISHEVKVRLATSQSGDPVFLEAIHFYVDSNAIQGNACQPFDTNNVEDDAAPAPSAEAPLVEAPLVEEPLAEEPLAETLEAPLAEATPALPLPTLP